MTMAQWLPQTSEHCHSCLSRESWGLFCAAELGDDTAAAVAAAEAGTVAAGAAGTAAAVVGNVVTTPNGRQAGVGQSCRALSAAIGVARL